MGDTKARYVQMQPGIIKDVTTYMAEGGWVDSDKIRFRNSRAEKLGGWVSQPIAHYNPVSSTLNEFSTAFSSDFSYASAISVSPSSFNAAFSIAFGAGTFLKANSFTGVSRAVLTWVDLQSNQYLASASNQKLELLNNGLIYDITPFRLTSQILNGISTKLGSNVVTINVPANGVSVGDFLSFESSASSAFSTAFNPAFRINTLPVGGIVLSGEYVVNTVIDVNNFTILVDIPATATVSLGGFGYVVNFNLANGPASNGGIIGYGGGSYGTPGQNNGGYGMPRISSSGLNLVQWSLDNWGQDLIACQRGGGLYQWVAANGVSQPAQTIANAPTQNNFMLVAEPARFLCVFGTQVEATGIFDPMVIRWASQETLTTWNIDVTNTSGEYRLPSGNYIIGACQTLGQIIVYTDTNAYSMTYIGGTDIFEFQPLGSNISAISQHAFIDVNGVVFWMGRDKFYMYNGIVNTLPCSVSKYLFDPNDPVGNPINFQQKEKVFCGVNKAFNELWWFYPQWDEQECGHYVKYNYLENVWDLGTIDRTVWVDKGVFETPYGINAEGVLYAHETGLNDDSQPMDSYITTAYFDISEGTDLMFVDKIIPDLFLASNIGINISVLTKNYPHPQADVVSKGPFLFTDQDDKISCRARGRLVALKFEANANNADFEIGRIHISTQPDGERG